MTGLFSKTTSWGLVAGPFDSLLEFGEARLCGIEGDAGAPFLQRDVHGRNTGHAAEHPRDALDAALAIHAFDLQFDGFHLLSSSELETTDTELSAIAAPAITGLSIPAAASGRPRTL